MARTRVVPRGLRSVVSRPLTHGASASRIAVVCIAVVAMLSMLPRESSVAAADVPPAGGFVIQTSGPNAGLGVGDWYTAATGGAGFNYLTITVPCGWPAASPLYVDLFSPEMNLVAGALNRSEEPRGTYDTTEFELYAPGTAIGPGFANPPAGGGISGTRVSYPPGAAGIGEAWVRYASLDPTVCGTYVLRSAVSANDDNGWRVRVGTDDDANPNNVPPLDSDNPDGLPGTNDEIIIGQDQITYQHDLGGDQCLTLFEYVAPGQASATFHNFDLDGNRRVRYYAPSAVYDPTGLSGGTVGTLSGNAAWNSGVGSTRGGDTISSPEAGWWRIVTCLSNHNQFIQEGQLGSAAFFAQPPTPQLTLTKDDGTSVATAGEALTYTLRIENVATGPTSGAATSVVVSDALPAGTTFAACSFVAPASGTCSESGGLVTATLAGWINAGQAVEIELTVSVASDASGPLTNDAELAYADTLGNPYPVEVASDVDAVNLPPIAEDDAATTEQDNPVAVDVLANDSDPDGTLDPATVSVVTAPANGTLVVDPISGQITYQPAAGWSGVESFTYRVCDDQGACATATVTITVQAPAATPTPTPTTTPTPPTGVVPTASPSASSGGSAPPTSVPTPQAGELPDTRSNRGPREPVGAGALAAVVACSAVLAIAVRSGTRKSNRARRG